MNEEIPHFIHLYCFFLFFFLLLRRYLQAGTHWARKRVISELCEQEC